MLVTLVDLVAAAVLLIFQFLVDKVLQTKDTLVVLVQEAVAILQVAVVVLVQ
jgi:hypothetical protein